MDGERPSIPTNLRLIAVLEEVARAGRPVTPTEVNAAMGLPKPTIHRLFATLVEEGFLERDLDGRSYAPAGRARRLAAGLLSGPRIEMARRAILRALSEQVGETCNLAMPDGEGMVYVDRVETDWPLRIQLPVGTRVPFHCTAAGKTYLASLGGTALDGYLASARLDGEGPGALHDPDALRAEIEATRARGYGVCREEFIEGMVAIAVPVTGGDGRLMATLSFHAPTLRMDLAAAEAHLPDLREAAGRLAALVGD